MNKDYKKEVEKIFRESNSSNELFDAFHFALSKKISDLESYKILLANPALSKDEIKMFTEKLSSLHTDKAFDIYSWSAGVLENKTTDYTFIEDAVNYYIKAAHTDPAKHEPLVRLTRLFNYEINFPTNTTILNFINDGVASVKEKRKVYNALADVYKKLGNETIMKRYKELAAKSARNENQ